MLLIKNQIKVVTMLLLFFLCLIFSCSKSTTAASNSTEKAVEPTETTTPVVEKVEPIKMVSTETEVINTESGLTIEIYGRTNGKQVTKGVAHSFHYKGMLLDGTKFDSSYDRNAPFTVVLGQGRVIKGWEEGLLYFKVGEKGKITIPPNMAYGNRAMGNVIKANSTLVFEVEVVE